MTDNRKQVNFVVSEEQKQDWEEYADERQDFTSLSDLIRKSVHREIAGNGASSTESGAVEVDLSGVVESLDELHTKVDIITDQLETIEALSETPGEEVTQLAEEIYDLLPTVTDPQELDTRLSRRGVPSRDDITRTGRFDVIAEVFLDEGTGRSKYDIRKACERLLTDMARVERQTVGDNTTVYYVREPSSGGESRGVGADVHPHQNIHQNVEVGGEDDEPTVDQTIELPESQDTDDEPKDREEPDEDSPLFLDADLDDTEDADDEED